VLQRIAEMLGSLRTGYREKTEVRTQPRGRIDWPEYLRRQMATGQWHRLPCRFSELGSDRRLRQAIRWTLERVQGELRSVANDSTANTLSSMAILLLEEVADVVPSRPRPGELQRSLGGSMMASRALVEGLRAIGWVADERGLGGGRTSDGLAWSLPLEGLWERYVESVYRAEALRRGAIVRSGNSGETTVPLGWQRGDLKSMTHLVPDLVIAGHDEVQIVDAKYKPHFQELTVGGWQRFTESAREAHRADIHQVLAYAATLPAHIDARATLVYPVTALLAEELTRREIGTAVAEIPRGAGRLRLELRALAFGGATVSGGTG
jgi:5-methylcytosine-specific restriction endonuclease McrBC regulatory subunit McrC